MGRKHHEHSNSEHKWDYIIVGLGSAGSILVRKLTDAGHSVFVIEAGANFQNDPTILSPEIVPIVNQLTYDPLYASTYPIPLGPLQNVTYSEGKMWGGSSGHNFLYAVRGSPNPYNEWATITGDSGWSYDSLLPLMKAVEKYTPNGTTLNPNQRGTVGPIAITQKPPLLTPDPFVEAYDNITNITDIEDYNDGVNGILGSSAVQRLVTSGNNSRRSYSNLEFLPVGVVIDKNGNGLHGRKLKIESNANAYQIEFSKSKRAEHVKYIKNGKSYKVFLKRKGTLILSAGTLQTPKLLLLSGIGPADELKSLNIPVVLDSPNVGKNLIDQYGAYAIYLDVTQINDPVYKEQTNIFIDGSINSPDFTGLPATGERKIQVNILYAGGGITQTVSTILSPNVRGSVTLTDKNLLTPVQISLPLYTDGTATDVGSDINTVMIGLQAIYATIKNLNITYPGRFILLSPSPTYFAAPLGPAPNNDSLIQYIQTTSSIFLQHGHMVGTCRMGTNISNSVVNSKLKVHGLKNVRVCDISIEPTIIDGNTCMSAYYIALKLCRDLGLPDSPVL